MMKQMSRGFLARETELLIADLRKDIWWADWGRVEVGLEGWLWRNGSTDEGIADDEEIDS